MNPDLENLRGLEWLVAARKDCQSLLLRLLKQWETLPTFRRDEALGAAFSLWRAVFLLIREPAQEQAVQSVDSHAKKLLEKLIRTNTISFGDDLGSRRWSSNYYVENAVSRIKKLTGHEFEAYGTSPVGSVRDAWNEAYRVLDDYLAGRLPLPHDE